MIRRALSWKLAHIDEVPAIGPAATGEFWRQWTDEPGYEDGWRSVRAHMALEAFGVNAKEASEGAMLVVPHRETDFGGQEELYVLVAGRARFTLDDATVELGPGDLLAVAPGVQREARALETPTTVLMIGGVPGAAYAPD